MAKILPGPLAAKISGTIGGTTYQNWRGMVISRTKPTPTNVNSPRQTFIRSLMTTLSRAWRDELNEGLRTAWNQRAKNYPWLDVFGNERKMTGENLYIKQNMVLLDNEMARNDTPVPDVVPPELGDVTAAVEENSYTLTVPKLPDALVTAQTPFIDVTVAGGFLSVDETDFPLSVPIQSQCLPAGRKHQKSDFRHCSYFPAMSETHLEPEQYIVIAKPDHMVKNVVVSIRRYNKYGNFTVPLIFSVINDFVD